MNTWKLKKFYSLFLLFSYSTFFFSLCLTKMNRNEDHWYVHVVCVHVCTRATMEKTLELPFLVDRIQRTYIILWISLYLFLSISLSLPHSPFFWDAASILPRPFSPRGSCTFAHSKRFVSFFYPPCDISLISKKREREWKRGRASVRERERERAREKIQMARKNGASDNYPCSWRRANEWPPVGSCGRISKKLFHQSRFVYLYSSVYALFHTCNTYCIYTLI